MILHLNTNPVTRVNLPDDCKVTPDKPRGYVLYQAADGRIWRVLRSAIIMMEVDPTAPAPQ